MSIKKIREQLSVEDAEDEGLRLIGGPYEDGEEARETASEIDAEGDEDIVYAQDEDGDYFIYMRESTLTEDYATADRNVSVWRELSIRKATNWDEVSNVVANASYERQEEDLIAYGKQLVNLLPTIGDSIAMRKDAGKKYPTLADIAIGHVGDPDEEFDYINEETGEVEVEQRGIAFSPDLAQTSPYVTGYFLYDSQGFEYPRYIIPLSPEVAEAIEEGESTPSLQEALNIINELQAEAGPEGWTLKVGDEEFSPSDASGNIRKAFDEVRAKLKKDGKLKDIRGEYDTSPWDIVFKADGTAIVSDDEGKEIGKYKIKNLPED